MVIGFTERSQTVSEGQEPGLVFQLMLGVSTLRTAERLHSMVFRYQPSSSSAIVEPLIEQLNLNYDALFGSRSGPTDPIQEGRDLEWGASDIQPLFTLIRDDVIVEPDECYVIRIFPADIEGRRELFTCNEDSSGATSFFCEHTICIEDDDGKNPLVFRLLYYQQISYVILLLHKLRHTKNYTFPVDMIYSGTSE